MKTLLALAASAALALSATAASADSLADTIMAKPSTEATVGLHMSLGGKAHQAAKPAYGAALGFRAGGQTVSQSLTTPSAKIAQFDFSGGEVKSARIGGYDFAQSGSAATGDRLGFASEDPITWVWIVAGVGLVWYLVDQGNKGDRLYH